MCLTLIRIVVDFEFAYFFPPFRFANRFSCALNDIQIYTHDSLHEPDSQSIHIQFTFVFSFFGNDSSSVWFRFTYNFSNICALITKETERRKRRSREKKKKTITHALTLGNRKRIIIEFRKLYQSKRTNQNTMELRK